MKPDTPPPVVIDESAAVADAPKENGVGAGAGAAEQSAPAAAAAVAAVEELSAEELLEDVERVYAPYELKAILFKNVPGSMKSADLEKVRTQAQTYCLYSSMYTLCHDAFVLVYCCVIAGLSSSTATNGSLLVLSAYDTSTVQSCCFFLNMYPLYSYIKKAENEQSIGGG